MTIKDERIDTYIEKSAEFAQPLLHHFRRLVHKACPDVLETMKWSIPFFEYKGTLCAMAGFKNHCNIIFWKAPLLKDPHQLFDKNDEEMGKLRNLKSLEDLPSDDILLAYLKEAVELNEKGMKMPAKSKNAEKKELAIPESLISALEQNASAAETFEKFSYSNKKEYVEWINEAKTEETRNKRLATAIEWMAEGKPRNWKYLTK